MIPFVISEACPDYKRPYLLQDFGTVKEEEMHTYFLERICFFILDRIDKDSITCAFDIEEFFGNYYNEYYMDNSPWDAMVFRNGDWENVNPSYESIWEQIQLMKSEDAETEDSEVDDANVDDANVDDSKEVKDDASFTKIYDVFVDQMEQIIKELLNNTIITPEMMLEIQDMSYTQRLYYILSKIQTINPEQYNVNKTIFHNFLNLTVILCKEDIQHLSLQLQKEHDDEVADQLTRIINLYNSIINVKQQFNF